MVLVRAPAHYREQRKHPAKAVSISATVASSFNASSATFALNAAL